MKWYLKRLLILVMLVIIASPCIFCFWFAVGNNIWMQLSLRLYPGLEAVGDDYQYFGAGSGEKISYFWTNDPIEKVEAYYATFTFPFIDDHYKRYSRLTVFNVSGVELKVYTIEGKSRPFDYPNDSYCDYKQTYQCVNIWLRDLKAHPLKDPPLVAPPSLKYVKGIAPARLPKSGTLVTYGYYVWDP